MLKISYSPITAVWEHDLPDAIARPNGLSFANTVRLTHYEQNSPAPVVTINLSTLGGPTALELTPVDQETYKLDTHLDLQGVPFGLHHVQLRIEQVTPEGLQSQQFSHPIIISPPDFPIFDETFANDWRLVDAGGTQALDLDTEGPVFNGTAALAIQVEPENFFTPWALELLPPAPVDRATRAGLHFAFHPGDAQSTNPPNMILYIDGLSADLTRGPQEFRLDLERPEWQVIEIPFTTFDVIQKYGDPIVLDSVKTIPSVRLEGNVTGTFYLDDIRLVASIPADPPHAPFTAVLETQDKTLPTTFALQQNYPNPFNSETIFRYRLPQRATVFLDVYNLVGQQVARLVYGLREPGVYTVQWDGRNNADEELATGMYIYRLRVGRQTISRKLMLIR